MSVDRPGPGNADRLRLPDPRGGRRLSALAVVALFSLAVPVVGLLWVTVSAGPSWLTGQVGGSPVLALSTVSAIVVFALLAPLLLIPAKVEVKRVDRALLGLEAGPLPVDEGRMVITPVVDGLAPQGVVFDLHHVTDARSLELVHHSHRPTRLRAFTEGLCRLGGYEMVWRSPEGDELRIPTDLDTPLGDRLATGQAEDTWQLPVAPVRTRALPLGGVEIPVRPPALLGLVLLFTPPAVALAFGGGLGGHDTPGAELMRLGLALGAGLALALGRYLLDLVAARPLTVTPETVRLPRMLLGLPAGQRVLETARLESLYLEQGWFGLWHLVFAGDRVHRRGGRFDSLGEAVAARRAVAEAMVGA